MKAFHLLILTILLFTFSATVKAADLQVSVFEVLSGSGNLQPIVGARVCVGTQSDPTQVGSLVMNDNSGQVTFNNVSPGQWIVIVSADGFRGQERTINIAGNFASSSFSMERCTRGMLGDCGPTCNGSNVGNRPAPRQPPNGDLTTLITRISDFYINHKEFERNDPTRRKPSLSISRDIRLYFNYTGVSPTQYRASESSDFENTTWNNLSPQSSTGDPFVNYTLMAGGPSRRTVYFQVRASSSLGGLPSLNSNVADDRVDLDPSANTAGRKRFSFKRDGFESFETFKSLVTYADDSGFDFTGEKVGTDGLLCEVEPGLLLSATGFETRQLLFSSYSKVTCSFNLFKGRRLNPGWKLISIDAKLQYPGSCNAEASSLYLPIESPYFLWTKIPSGTEDAHVTLTYFHMGGPQAPKCKKSGVYVTEIVLEGPAGGDWHDAFRRN